MRHCAVATLLLAATAAAEWIPVGPDGGRLQALAVDPAAPATLYAVSYEDTVSPRCYRSTDRGTGWREAGRLCDSLVTGLAVDPHDGSFVYACGRDTCIMRSTDRGITWLRSEVAGFCAAITPDPVVAGRVYACGYARAGTMRPVIFVSVDNGATWQRSFIDTLTGHGMCLAAGPAHGVLVGGSNGQFWRSTDAGATLVRRNAGLPPTATVLSASMSSTGVLLAGTTAGLFRSVDTGQNWGLVAAEEKSWRAVWAAADPATAYSVGYDFTAGLYVSTDSGRTWGEAVPGTYVGRSDMLVPDPESAAAVYLCGNAGVKCSPDRAAHWGLRNAGMRFGTVTALRAAAHDRSHVYLATLDNGLFRSLSGGDGWERCADFTVCGHIADVRAVRGPDADIVYAIEGAG